MLVSVTACAERITPSKNYVTVIKVDTNFLILLLFYLLDVMSMPNVATFDHYFKSQIHDSNIYH